MLTAIIGAIVVGLIVGALGRLLLPGKQGISIPMTIVIGIVASVLTTLVTVNLFNYDNDGGPAWIQWILSIIVAAGLIVLYGNMVGGRKQIR
ncbi:MAG: GlsB/YeaQ/YmgE family stress response membrane protein [Tetrasphaera sp.]